ncbi:MAG: ATP-binding protein [Lachnospiraceae bacterium]|nr:ATP-binding protein [Lachnospiraceae bacterium]
MKKKINIQLMAIAAVAIFATMILISTVFYRLYREQIIEDLRTYSNLLVDSSLVEEMKKNDYGFGDDLIRLTLISADGTVQYDNEADNLIMNNHATRPEVLEAMEHGEGMDVRRSETMGRSTFYYARLLADGSILRVAKEAGSIWSIFYNALPFIMIMVILLLGICLVASHFLTKRLVAPIEQLAENLDNMTEISAYEELQPFLTMIQAQHEDIVKNSLIRQEFTANVSHELKTPLTSISGYAELIETGMASDEDVLRFARGIHKNSNRLLTLINDIIRLSELDGTEQEIVFEKVNLYQLAQTSLDMLQLPAEKHNVTLTLEGRECFIWANRQMVEEVLFNLCDNAIRYNNEGGSVVVSIREVDGKAELKITDTGIGIPAEARERIFERFFRVDKSRSKSTGGTGLGLAIVKHIIAKLNAEISLKSEVGKGTEITVIFQKSHGN